MAMGACSTIGARTAFGFEGLQYGRGSLCGVQYDCTQEVVMGILRDGMLQGLRYDPATKKWTTKTWELKKNPRLKTAAEEAKSPIIDGDGLELRLLPGGSMVWRVAYSFQKTRKSYTVGRYTGQEDGVSGGGAGSTDTG